MKKILKNIFLKIPRWYLSYIPFTPFSKEYRNYFNLLKEMDSLPEEEKIKIQNERLKFILKRASESDYYKSIGIGEKYNIENYNQIPFLTREMIQKNNLLIKQKDGEKLYKTYTSGSSGVPLELYRSKKEREREYANLDFVLTKIGIDIKKWVKVVSIRSYVKDGFSIYGNTLYLSYSLINKENLDKVIKIITDYEPQYIHAHPSLIIVLAKLLLEENKKIELKNFFGILTSSETFFKNQKKEVYKAFNCKIIDYYGNEENSVTAYQIYPDMEYYYFSKLYSYVEIIDNEIVSTALNMENVPLIRYKIGDLVDSNNINKVKQIVGRTKDYLIDKYDIKIPLENFSIHYYPGVEIFQFVQTEKGKVIFKVKVLSEEKFNLEFIKNTLNKIAPNIYFDIEKVIDFERNSRGKHKIIIREID
ncbi:hypothetical protein KSU01_01295 [Fusobacterium animalis]|uniref:hypothetical protein n=1 Tax=Fusobacterium animalis TaxID=76859 RepID=UPI0030D02F2C